MATLATLEKRLTGKQAALSKLEAKLSRIEAAEATGWEKNPYGYNEYDKKYTVRDIEQARAAIAKIEADIVTATEKAASRNVPQIVDFLNRWREQAHAWYVAGITEYYAERAEVNRLTDAWDKAHDTYGYRAQETQALKAEAEKARHEFFARCHGRYEKRTTVNRWGREVEESVKVEDGYYERYEPYTGERTQEDAVLRLERDLTAEWERKYDDIIERTNAVIGKITDATGLDVDPRGNLNGYIVGERGTATVETIGAGGYNIQCFHFRTLIHKVA